MKTSVLRNRISVVLAAAGLLWGCGYQFAASGTNLPASAQTIYVERFDNHTRVTGLNDIFMRYLEDEIANHKRLTVVNNMSQADLVLSGTVSATTQLPVGFNSVLEPTIYGDTLNVSAALRDNHKNKVVWSVGSLSDTEQFPVVGQALVATTPQFLQQNLRAHDITRMTDIQVAQTQESGARDQTMRNLAQHLYDAMASGF